MIQTKTLSNLDTSHNNFRILKCHVGCIACVIVGLLMLAGCSTLPRVPTASELEAMTADELAGIICSPWQGVSERERLALNKKLAGQAFYQRISRGDADAIRVISDPRRSDLWFDADWDGNLIFSSEEALSSLSEEIRKEMARHYISGLDDYSITGKLSCYDADRFLYFIRNLLSLPEFEAIIRERAKHSNLAQLKQNVASYMGTNGFSQERKYLLQFNYPVEMLLSPFWSDWIKSLPLVNDPALEEYVGGSMVRDPALAASLVALTYHKYRLTDADLIKTMEDLWGEFLRYPDEANFPSSNNLQFAHWANLYKVALYGGEYSASLVANRAHPGDMGTQVPINHLIALKYLESAFAVQKLQKERLQKNIQQWGLLPMDSLVKLEGWAFFPVSVPRDSEAAKPFEPNSDLVSFYVLRDLWSQTYNSGLLFVQYRDNSSQKVIELKSERDYFFNSQGRGILCSGDVLVESPAIGQFTGARMRLEKPVIVPLVQCE